MSELMYRRATEADRPAIIELLRVSLGREVDDRYEQLFAWKHDEGAFGRSPAWVAVDGGRLAGFRTFMRWEFVEGSELRRAVRAVDTATHPDYQGRGIFTGLTRHALGELEGEGVDFVFNTPNDQSRPGYLKMGWEEVGQLPTLVRPTQLRKAGLIARARVPAERWSEPSTAGLPAASVLDDGAELAALVAGLEPGPPTLRTRITPEYLRWRFGTPLLGYRAVVAPAGVEHGLALFRIRRRGPARELALVAVLTRPGDRRTEAQLVRSAARGSDADYVLALGDGPRAPGGLVRLPGAGPILTWRSVTREAAPARWGLTLGDIELF